MNKLTLGILIGFGITILILLVDRCISPAPYEYIREMYKFQNDSMEITKDEVEKSLIELRITDQNIEEKINSLDKRIDDILIFGGIIITLVLAINVGVYVKAENEVEKHFRENFEIYKIQINDNAAEVRKLLNEIRSDAAVVEKLKDRMQNDQTP